MDELCFKEENAVKKQKDFKGHCLDCMIILLEPLIIFLTVISISFVFLMLLLIQS